MELGDDQRGRGASLGTLRSGIGLLAEGAGFLRSHRTLWLLALVPIVFATLAVGSAIVLFWQNFDWIHQAWIDVLPVLEAGAWWSWLWVGPGIALFWLLGWVGVLLAFALSLVAALLLANLASAPFLDRLSVRVESIVRGEPPPSGGGLAATFAETARSLVAEFQRLLFFAAIWLALSGIGFVVPGAHLVTGPVLVVVTVILLPLDYAGFALDRRQLSFRSRRRWLAANLPTSLGFGGIAFAACLVPGLNLLIGPALVTGGTLLVLRSPPEPREPGER